MAKYIVTTENSTTASNAMNSYSGTTLLYTDAAFLVWLWVDPRAPNLAAAITTISAIGSHLVVP
jgi:hypothetical protein